MTRNAPGMRPQSDPVCCNLQSGRKQMSLNPNDFLGNSRLQNPDCRNLPQSGKPLDPSDTYDQIQIARDIYINNKTGGVPTPPVFDGKSARPTRVVKQIHFNQVPPLGTVLMIGGQRYELVGTSPYRRHDGRETRLLHWESHCPECGSRFTATSGLKANAVNRRCSQHHRAGVPVSGARRTWRGKK